MRTVVVATAGVALLGGGTAVALAQTGEPAPPAASSGESGESGENGGKDDDGPSVKGSITVPEQAGEQDEAAEQQALAGLATVTPDEAVRAATAAEPGTAGPAELGDEDGSLVYEVVVTRADGSAVEVKIDAGNAAVLATEAEDGGAESGSEDAQENGEQPETGSAEAVPAPR